MFAQGKQPAIRRDGNLHASGSLLGLGGLFWGGDSSFAAGCPRVCVAGTTQQPRHGKPATAIYSAGRGKFLLFCGE